ncbi:MAG: hypothetical protein QXT45_04935 [Candidatus Bilamarchaeaceae archaeon]
MSRKNEKNCGWQNEKRSLYYAHPKARFLNALFIRAAEKYKEMIRDDPYDDCVRAGQTIAERLENGLMLTNKEKTTEFFVLFYLLKNDLKKIEKLGEEAYEPLKNALTIEEHYIAERANLAIRSILRKPDGEKLRRKFADVKMVIDCKAKLDTLLRELKGGRDLNTETATPELAELAELAANSPYALKLLINELSNQTGRNALHSFRIVIVEALKEAAWLLKNRGDEDKLNIIINAFTQKLFETDKMKKKEVEQAETIPSLSFSSKSEAHHWQKAVDESRSTQESNSIGGFSISKFLAEFKHRGSLKTMQMIEKFLKDLREKNNEEYDRKLTSLICELKRALKLAAFFRPMWENIIRTYGPLTERIPLDVWRTEIERAKESPDSDVRVIGEEAEKCTEPIDIARVFGYGEDIAYDIIRCLGNLGEPRALGILASATAEEIQDKYKSFRKAALRAIKNILRAQFDLVKGPEDLKNWYDNCVRPLGDKLSIAILRIDNSRTAEDIKIEEAMIDYIKWRMGQKGNGL